MFEVLVREASARFNLGDKGLPLLQIVLQYMTGGGARGLAEFLERFKAAGLGPTVQSWLGGGPVAKPISNEELDRVLGSSDGLIATLTDKLALDRESVTSALGYLLPSLVGKLTPGGSLPSRIPPEIQALAAEGKRRLEAPASRAPVATAPGGAMRWLPWVIVALAVVLALGYCSTRDKPGEAGAPASGEPASPVTPDGTDTAPATGDAGVSPDSAAHEGDAATAAGEDHEMAPAADADAAHGDVPADASAPETATPSEPEAEAGGDDAPGVDAGSGDAADTGVDDAVNSSGAADIGAGESTDSSGAADDGAGGVANPGDAADTGADEAVDAGADEASDAMSRVQAEVVDGKPVVKVFFDSGDATVPADFAQQAQELDAYLQEHPDAQLDVSGFTDTTGSAELNDELAKSRAQAVQAALILMGISEDRMVLEKPQQVSDAGDDQAAARRVEVTLREE